LRRLAPGVNEVGRNEPVSERVERGAVSAVMNLKPAVEFTTKVTKNTKGKQKPGIL
jgi:hypothetical protein